MPVNDPRAGRAFVWLVTSFLFISIAIGGGCLITYMVLSDSDAPSWLLLAGITLVCFPWLFWCLTFVYRVFSRVCGFRVGIGNVCVGGDGVDNARGNNNNNNNDDAVDDENVTPVDPPQIGSTGNGTQFPGTAAAVTDDGRDGHVHVRNGGKHSRSSSNSSILSHESEMPLALSMAS